MNRRVSLLWDSKFFFYLYIYMHLCLKKRKIQTDFLNTNEDVESICVLAQHTSTEGLGVLESPVVFFSFYTFNLSSSTLSACEDLDVCLRFLH